MRWISGIVAALTLGLVAWLGFAPASAGLSNGVDALECRAPLAQVEKASLVENLTPQQESVAQDWLVAVGYIAEGGTPTADEMAAVVANVQSLCGEARQGRAVWLTITAVVGAALALAAWTAHPRIREKEEAAHG